MGFGCPLAAAPASPRVWSNAGTQTCDEVVPLRSCADDSSTIFGSADVGCQTFDEVLPPSSCAAVARLSVGALIARLESPLSSAGLAPSLARDIPSLCDAAWASLLERLLQVQRFGRTAAIYEIAEVPGIVSENAVLVPVQSSASDLQEEDCVSLTSRRCGVGVDCSLRQLGCLFGCGLLVDPDVDGWDWTSWECCGCSTVLDTPNALCCPGSTCGFVLCAACASRIRDRSSMGPASGDEVSGGESVM
jgi:hypothetical protein